MRLLNPSARILAHLEYMVMLKVICTAVAHCYKAAVPTDQKGMEAFIRARLKTGHESVIEHVGFSATFQVDRGVTHEMVRHRLCAFTQESTRYCNYSRDKFGGHVAFIMPPYVQNVVPEGEYALEWENRAVPDGPEGMQESFPVLIGRDGFRLELDELPSVQLWLAAMASSESYYLAATSDESKEALAAIHAPEWARAILPQAVKAEITWTANMREWRHIFKLRALGTTGRPHPQMAEVMTPLLTEAKRRFPVFFEDL